MKKKKNLQNENNLIAFFKTLPKYKLPWNWIACAFIFNIVFNQVLLEIPSTTADLLGGSLDSSALMKAICYYVLYGFLSSIQSYSMLVTESYAVFRSRKSLWNKMLHTKVKYYDENEASELMSAITNDVSVAMGRLVNMIIFILPDILYLIQAFLKISHYHIALVFAELIILPLKYIYMIVLGRYTQKVNAKLYDKIGKLTGYLAERINNLAHIKLFNAEKIEINQGEKVAQKIYESKLDLAKLDFMSTGAQTIISIIEKFIVMMAAVLLLQKNIITIQQWVAFFLFSSDISLKFDGFVGAWLTLKLVQGSATRSISMMNADVEEVGKGNQEGQCENTCLEFKHVSFSYGDHKALRDVSFHIPSGTSLGIVGLCGSGKTTILNLIERFYDADSGEIDLGNINIEKIPLSTYRSDYSYVQQGADIFVSTIKEALTYGMDREVTDKEIYEAAQFTGFDHYLKTQPEGLNTHLSMGSSSLSGGQSQRLVLTRELLRNTDIILMDEPTSALDVETAKKIRELIQNVFVNKTKVIVTHDLELARMMDQIIVLNKGELVGQGKYNELLEGCPLFKEMVESFQQKVEAVES